MGSIRCGEHLNWPVLASLTLILGLVFPTGAAAQISRLPVPDTTRGNYFGAAVSLSEDLLLAGASGDATCGPNAGAAYLYRRLPTEVWEPLARLAPDECGPEEYFGKAVALEPGLAVVTSFVPSFQSVRSNAVYVFEPDETGAWQQTGKLLAPGNRDDGAFASSVALSKGRILVTSAGDTAGGTFGGRAYVYERNVAARWVQTAVLTVPHDARLGVFGASCDLDGERAVVTSSTYGLGSPGSAYIFNQKDGIWLQTARIDGIDDYFIPVDLDGNRLITGQTRDGEDHTGRAVIYEQIGAKWIRVAELRPDSPYPSGGFGSDVAISGDLAAVVGFDEQLKLEFNIDRVVFVFGRDSDGIWRQHRIIDVGEVYFGAAIDMEGGTLVIGQASEDEPGSIYLAAVR